MAEFDGNFNLNKVKGAMTFFAFLNFRSSGEQLPSRPPAPPVAPDSPPTT